MEQYSHYPKYGLLSIRHFNDFVGAEGTIAIATTNRLLSKNDRLALKYITIDFRKVRSATLYNTDRALHSLLHQKILTTPDGLTIYRLYEQENPMTAILLERLNRTQDITEQSGFVYFEGGQFYK